MLLAAGTAVVFADPAPAQTCTPVCGACNNGEGLTAIDDSALICDANVAFDDEANTFTADQTVQASDTVADVDNPLVLRKVDSDSAGSAGLGVGLLFQLEDAASTSTQIAGGVQAIWSDATDTSEDSDLAFWNMFAGSSFEAARFRGFNDDLLMSVDLNLNGEVIKNGTGILGVPTSGKVCLDDDAEVNGTLEGSNTAWFEGGTGNDGTPNRVGVQIGGDGTIGTIELTGNNAGPLIDFQNSISGEDFDVRLQLQSDNELDVEGGALVVENGVGDFRGGFGQDGTLNQAGVQVGGDGTTGTIELMGNGTGPLIDFSNNTGADFDARINLQSDDELRIDGAGLKVNHSSRAIVLPSNAGAAGTTGLSGGDARLYFRNNADCDGDAFNDCALRAVDSDGNDVLVVCFNDDNAC
jgi:hypothetical protein